MNTFRLGVRVKFYWNSSKLQCFCKFRWLYWKIYFKIYQTTTSSYSRIDLELIKNKLFPVKKWVIQVIVYIIMLTRSSEMILRYTWNALRWSHFYAKFRVVSGNMRKSFLNLIWLASCCGPSRWAIRNTEKENQFEF